MLRRSSCIGGIHYLPWDGDVDARPGLFDGPFASFEDDDGLPALSKKQESYLAGWLRPHQLVPKGSSPRIVSRVERPGGTSLVERITQDVVTDCSFVASLCVTAGFELSFRRQLIMRCLHPQTASGEPIYNPHGKYVVMLHMNGVRRKVCIDDRLPVSASGHPLCAYSTDRTEFWVSLLEKAYMKVMGG